MRWAWDDGCRYITRCWTGEWCRARASDIETVQVHVCKLQNMYGRRLHTRGWRALPAPGSRERQRAHPSTASWTGSIRNFALRRWGSQASDDGAPDAKGGTEDGDFVSTGPQHAGNAGAASSASSKPEESDTSAWAACA